MEDMHIHLKNAVFDQTLFNQYVQKCIAMKLEKVVFLDHGNRISSKHQPVLFDKTTIDEFNNRFLNLKKDKLNNKLEIIKGIEIDYSNNLDFRNETFKILKYGKFDWIAGAIHSLKFDNYIDYLNCIKDMIENYPINVIAHIKLDDDYLQYENEFNNILSICNRKKIFIEINTSDRSRWNDNQLYYMLKLMKNNKVKYVYASDAHKISEIGYKIEETKKKVDVWKKKK